MHALHQRVLHIFSVFIFPSISANRSSELSSVHTTSHNCARIVLLYKHTYAGDVQFCLHIYFTVVYCTPLMTRFTLEERYVSRVRQLCLATRSFTTLVAYLDVRSANCR